MSLLSKLRMVSGAARGIVACGMFTAGASLVSAQDQPAAPPAKPVVPKVEKPAAPKAELNGPNLFEEEAAPKKGAKAGPTNRNEPDIAPVSIGSVLETTGDGVLVKNVAAQSPAATAGLKRGDHIVRVGGQPVLTPDAVNRRFHTIGAGSKVELTVLRQGEEVPLLLVLPDDHKPSLLDSRKVVSVVTKPVQAAPVEGIAPQADYGWTISEKEGRVLVGGVIPGSAAATSGFQRGDRILEVNRKAIESENGFNSTVAGLTAGDVVIFQVERGTRSIPIEVTILGEPTADAAGPVTLESLARRQREQDEILRRILADLEDLKAQLRAKQ